MILKGPYPLGDFGQISAIISHRRPIIAPIIAPAICGYGLLIGQLADARLPTSILAAGIAWQLDDRQLISSMFDISLPTGFTPTAVTWQSVAWGQTT